MQLRTTGTQGTVSRSALSNDANRIEIQLRTACADGNLHAVVYVLELGKRATSVDAYDGKTPIMVAAHHGHADILVVLINSIPRKKLMESLFITDCDGFTAAHWAAYGDHSSALSVLTHYAPELIEYYGGCGLSVLDVANLIDAHEVQGFLAEHFPSMSSSIPSNTATVRIPKVCDDFKFMDIKNKILCNRRSAIGFISKAAKLSGCFNAMMSLPFYSVLISMGLVSLYSLLYLWEDLNDPIRKESKIRSLAMVVQFIGLVAQALLWPLYIGLSQSDTGSIPKGWSDTGVSASVPEAGNNEHLQNKKSYEDAIREIVSLGDILHNDKSSSGKKNPVPQSKLATSSTTYCCHKCRVYRPLRAGHSRMLNKCIPQYEHYCFFIRNEIDRDNYWLYVLCIVLASIFVMPVFLWVTTHFLFPRSIHPLRDFCGTMYRASMFAVKASASAVLHASSSTFLSSEYAGIATTSSSSALHGATAAATAAQVLQSNNGFSDPVADSHEAAAFNLKFLVTSNRGLYFLICFMAWVTSWWITLLGLLAGHTYFITNNITTGEYFSGHQRYWYVNKNINNNNNNKGMNNNTKGGGGRTKFTRPSVWENVCHRLFALPEDECYSEKDIKTLLSRPPQSLLSWVKRKSALLFTSSLNRPSKISLTHLD